MVDENHLLVGYDMGLGKTVVTIAAAERLIDEGKAGGGLVIVPASLKYQWLSKIEEFTDGANALVVDGDPKERLRAYHQIKEGKVEYAILNYEQVVNDWQYVRHLPRDFICGDEIQAIKTPSSQRGRKMKRLQAHYRWGLTGQPVENRAEEVFHIMEWVDPSLLGPAPMFDKTFVVRDKYGKVKRYRNLDLLYNTLQRRMVRKTWEDPDVKTQMPKVSQESILVPFDVGAAMLYRRIAGELLNVLESSTVMGGWNVLDHYEGSGTSQVSQAGEIMSRLTCLRMLCDHPELVRLSARMRTGDATEDDMLWGGSATGSAYAAELMASGSLNKLNKSPKLNATVEVVDDIMMADPRNKVVVFSFFKGSLALLSQRLERYGVALFHGGISPRAREIEKQRFLKDPDCRVFLSSDAGGVGVDLPVANYCVEASTKVLTANLRWIPAEELRPGDGIVGVEEHRRGGKGFSRRWEMGHVTTNKIEYRECYEVLLSNGDALVATPEHKMLVQTGKGDWDWREVRDLKQGWRVSKALDTWKRLDTYDAGWLAGILDGEGCISRVGNGLALSISQNEGYVLDRVWQEAKLLGFDLRDSGRQGDCRQLLVRGGKPEVARFLGTVGSQRLIGKWGKLIGEHVVQAVETPEVVSVRPAGMRRIAVLNTSTRTFLAEGYVQHNCISYDLPWSAGAFRQRNARIIRLSSIWPRVTLISMLMAGSIEERQYEALGQKQRIADAITDGKGISAKGTLSLTMDTLTDFLRNSSVKAA